jgi:hypothetical protein
VINDGDMGGAHFLELKKAKKDNEHDGEKDSPKEGLFISQVSFEAGEKEFEDRLHVDNV